MAQKEPQKRTKQQKLDDLHAEFTYEDVEWRVSRKSPDGNHAIVVPYLKIISIQKRLDEVLGADNWRFEFVPVQFTGGDEDDQASGFISTLSIRLEDSGEWLWKTNGGSLTNFDPIKGGMTDAQKRAAREWGIGRYLLDWGEKQVDLLIKTTGGAVYDHWEKVKINNKWEYRYWNNPPKPSSKPASTTLGRVKEPALPKNTHTAPSTSLGDQAKPEQQPAPNKAVTGSVPNGQPQSGPVSPAERYRQQFITMCKAALGEATMVNLPNDEHWPSESFLQFFHNFNGTNGIWLKAVNLAKKDEYALPNAIAEWWNAQQAENSSVGQGEIPF